MRFLQRARTVPTVEERPIRLWSPAQLVALLLGGAAIGFGVIALTRTGLDLAHLTRGRDSLLGFGHTPLLGVAEVGFGVLMVLAALGPIAGRNIMTLTGAAAAGLGLVVVAGWWSPKLTAWLGVSDRSGWLFIAVGGLALAAAFVAPVWTSGGPRVIQEPVVADPATATTADEHTPADEPTPAAPPRRVRRIRLPHLGHQEEPRVPEPERRLPESSNR